MDRAVKRAEEQFYFSLFNRLNDNSYLYSRNEFFQLKASEHRYINEYRANWRQSVGTAFWLDSVSYRNGFHLKKVLPKDGSSSKTVKRKYPLSEIVAEHRSITDDASISLIVISGYSNKDLDLVAVVFAHGQKPKNTIAGRVNNGRIVLNGYIFIYIHSYEARLLFTWENQTNACF